MKAKGNVYLVEDDPDLRMHLGDMLRHLGYHVSDFETASMFLNRAHPCSPAVLVLDMRMPQMSGLDLQKELLTKAWTLPIVFISGESQSQEIIDAMKLGAVDFLWKPFAQSDLILAIEKSLKLSAHQHEDQQRQFQVAKLHQSLSPRERNMLALMLLGHGNKDIASATGVMADTVKKYRAQILAKMQVNTFAELLALCKDHAPPANNH
jgi:FixJ family two-component response regulator